MKYSWYCKDYLGPYNISHSMLTIVWHNLVAGLQ